MLLFNKDIEKKSRVVIQKASKFGKVTDVLTFLEMLIESIFSKEVGGPEKGRL
jgi:hypothetical protein